MEQVLETRVWHELERDIEQAGSFVDDLRACLRQTIVGQEDLLEKLLVGLLGNGHILLEGVPGLAKTLAVKALSQAVGAEFARIQFTPDLLPADILGTMIFNLHTNEFSVKKGPVFANLVLADEINRAPEKVQSALLEVMQEQQVSIGGSSYALESPFLVLATQNPIEQGGTYELPEAQLDRFMLKVLISYPSLEEERTIVRHHLEPRPQDRLPALPLAEVLRAQELVRRVYVDEKVESYILDLVFCTRYPQQYGLAQLQPLIRFGSSPRGSINLALAARAQAFLQKRSFVLPEDVRRVYFDVLRHRIGLTYAARAESMTADALLATILATIPMP
ncbi:MoxR family ATPase [Hymenobacter sp. 15J16-1T3B]|uniref:AAA family ATPase n=1 Tax=Hymenobacter sp. 15J16-1T3B TaxID=2886941 RepID=UPI001D11947A|nr:MoxR family ATPase [Hymenobacter sp. 15J16-1T3B]MCC3158591.1 MoxR family ATPase [Hymenobacter sp. 15J16-1T3B]